MRTKDYQPNQVYRLTSLHGDGFIVNPNERLNAIRATAIQTIYLITEQPYKKDSSVHYVKGYHYPSLKLKEIPLTRVQPLKSSVDISDQKIQKWLLDVIALVQESNQQKEAALAEIVKS